MRQLITTIFLTISLLAPLLFLTAGAAGAHLSSSHCGHSSWTAAYGYGGGAYTSARNYSNNYNWHVNSCQSQLSVTCRRPTTSGGYEYKYVYSSVSAATNSYKGTIRGAWCGSSWIYYSRWTTYWAAY